MLGLGLGLNKLRSSGLSSFLKGAMVWGFKSKFNWDNTSTDIWGFANPNDIDPEAQAVYDRIIADGGVSNLTRLNYFVVGLKTIYGTLANVPVCYDAHWIGYKLGSGTGATAGQAVAKLYTISVIQSVTDSDAQAFIYRVYNAGGELTDTEASAVNQLVLDMKSAGVWTAMKAVYPMVGASAAACAQNLKSSSFTGTFNGGWTYASTGVTPNGTNAYMDTFYNSSIDGNLNDGFIGTYLRTNNLGTPSCDFGNYNGSSSAITIYARFADSQLGRWNDVNDTALSTTDSRGWRFVNRNSATTKNNGINNTVANTIAPAISTINAKIYLSALSTNNTPSQYSNRQCALACLGNGLTDTQASDLYTAVQAFQTTLSRQV